MKDFPENFWKHFGGDIIRFVRDIVACLGVLIAIEGVSDATLPRMGDLALKLLLVYAVVLSLRKILSKP